MPSTDCPRRWSVVATALLVLGTDEALAAPAGSGSIAAAAGSLAASGRTLAASTKSFAVPASSGSPAVRAGSTCLDTGASTGLLCLAWRADASANLVTFNATCRPPRGQSLVFWCGFGVSNATTTTMFPTQAYVAQWDPLASAGFLEDRDSAVGYTAPPCYAPNPAPSSLLAIASDAATGALSFAWSRPLALPPAALAAGKFDVVADGVTPMTILGASSSDSAPAAARCDAFMQPHSLVQPGVAVVL